MTTSILYALPYSPWSEKARWALDHCATPYKERLYQSLLGELPMRLRTGRWRGPITVPLLISGRDVLSDSLDIARYANQRAGASLFPPDQDAAIDRINTLSERLLAAGRRRTTHAVVADDAALRASMAAALPGGQYLPAAVAHGTARWLLRKYGALEESKPDEALMASLLDELREALSGRDTLLDGGFSYADISAAVGLQFIAPPKRLHPTIPPTALPHWHTPPLAEAFADLIEWRDRIYTDHR